MKQSLISFFAGAVITGAIFYFICCLNNSSPQSSQTNKTQASKVGEDSACEKWHKIEQLSNQYITEWEEKNKLREEKNPGFTQPLEKAFGETYMESYRNTLAPGSNNSLSILIDAKTLAFFEKYLTDNGLTEIQACFGKYDRALLSTKGLDDPVLTAQAGTLKDRNTHYTLIFGIKDPTGTRSAYALPFTVAGKVFYDDWNQEWP